jgi:uncharacterized membrane protein
MGFFIAMLSALSTTAKDVVSKTVSTAVHPDLSTCASFLFALPYYAIIILIAYSLGYEDFIFSAWFLALVGLRSITDVCAEGCKMRALTHGDISLVTAFLSLSPLILAVISPLITGDSVTLLDALGLTLIVLGSLLLLRKDSLAGEIFQLKAIAYACASSFAFALNHCFDRLAVSESSPLLAGFAVTLSAGLFTLPFALRHKNFYHTLAANQKPLWLRGALETTQLFSKLVAMSLLEAHIVVGLLRLSLLSTVISGRLFFGESLATSRFIPSLIIYVGIVVLLWGNL